MSADLGSREAWRGDWQQRLLAADAFRPPNPFATCFTRPGALAYRAAADGSSSGDDLLNPLADAVLRRGRAAICGPHGSGKSTLLAALLPVLQQRVADIAHCTLHGDHRSRPALGAPLATLGAPLATLGRMLTTPRRWLLVIDGWEQLLPPVAAAVAAACRLRRIRLLVTCHRPCRAVPVVWQTGPDVATARAMTESLLSRCPEYHGRIMARFDDRWQFSGGNVRELWFALYDDFEALLRDRR